MDPVVKMTVRLPRRLHARLARQARQSQRSLNAFIVEALAHGGAPPMVTSDAEAVRGALARCGLWTKPDRAWSSLADASAEISLAQLHASLAGVPALSEAILADRGPKP